MDVRDARPGGDERDEPRPGDAGPGRAGQDRGERRADPLHELGLGAPQPLEPVELDLDPPEGRVGRVGLARRSPD